MPVNVLAPAFPLEKNEDGKYKTYSSEEIIQIVDQNIKMVLLTRKGERIGRPDFGVGLHAYLFEIPNDIGQGTNQPPLRESILSQLSSFMPYISVEDLVINYGNSASSLNIKIKYSVSERQTASVFDLTISDVESIPHF